MDPENSEALKLGGNIELVGFRSFDSSSMVIAKKIVGNYARKFSDMCDNFESLTLRVKRVHGHPETAHSLSGKFELHGKIIDNGKHIVSEVTDRNIFVVVDKVCKKLEHSLKR